MSRPLERHMYIRESIQHMLAQSLSSEGLRNEKRHTFAAANHKVLIRATKCRSNDELFLHMCFEPLNHIPGIDLHKLDLIGTHADEHMPRVLANHDTRQLDIIELELCNLVVANQVEHDDGALGDYDEALAVGRDCEVVCAELAAVAAEVVFQLAVEVPDAAGHSVVLGSDDDAAAGGVPGCGCTWVGKVADTLYTYTSLCGLASVYIRCGVFLPRHPISAPSSLAVSSMSQSSYRRDSKQDV
jgi:hypothetical protein